MTSIADHSEWIRLTMSFSGINPCHPLFFSTFLVTSLVKVEGREMVQRNGDQLPVLSGTSAAGGCAAPESGDCAKFCSCCR